MRERQIEEKPLYKVAAFIVDRRKAFYLIYILLIVFSLFSSGWVSVNNDITDYLADETETKRGLTLMENEFTTYATASVMVDNIALSDAEALCDVLEDIEGVKEISFDDTEKHYNGGAALFSVTFDGENDDPVCETALHAIEETLADYDTCISAEVGDATSARIASEMNLVMLIACVIILVVLLLSSHTYMEIPVLILTFGAAALLNKGTNYLLGTISFISNSIAVVLQLALAIDYAIILCHRYTEERETKEAREAVITALCKSIPEISGSCLTTLSGLAAMGFMQFKIGLDMSIVLIKAIIISILTVFTLMPGLLMSFSPLIDKTHHKSFIPRITAWNNAVVKTRFVTPCIFVALIVGAFFLSNACPYAYSYTNLSTVTQNESQIAAQRIRDAFGTDNVLAVMVPVGDYEKEQALQREFESLPEVDSVTGLASIEAVDGYKIGDKLTPRQFSELVDMDIETVRLLYAAYAAEYDSYGRIVGGIDSYKISLIDVFDFIYDMMDNGYFSLDGEMQSDLDDLHEALLDGKKQLVGETHTRLILNLNLPEESEETFAFLTTVKDIAGKYYGDDVLLAGNSTSDRDLSAAFGRDNLIISILSILFVLIVLFFTFQSAGIPVILILVIQGSIWLNFSFPTLQSEPLFFMSYLVVSSIQMGANIDYAIVIASHYQEQKAVMPHKQAIVQALNAAFPTVFTSGTIMASAGLLIGNLSAQPVVSILGTCLGRGTIISIGLVLLVLPAFLVLGDSIINRTSFHLKTIEPRVKTASGTLRVQGHVRGYLSGMVDADFEGVLRGQLNATVSTDGRITEEEGGEEHE